MPNTSGKKSITTHLTFLFITQDLQFDGEHPIVYSAINSHASYEKDATFVLPESGELEEYTDIVLPLSPPVLGKMLKLEIIDTTEVGAAMAVYDKKFNIPGGFWWMPHETNNFVIMQDQPWVNFPGTWGLGFKGPKKTLEVPSVNTCDMEYPLYLIGQAAAAIPIPKVAEKLEFEGGPQTPSRQKSWRLGEKPPGPPAMDSVDDGLAEDSSAVARMKFNFSTAEWKALGKKVNAKHFNGTLFNGTFFNATLFNAIRFEAEHFNATL